MIRIIVWMHLLTVVKLVHIIESPSLLKIYFVAFKIKEKNLDGFPDRYFLKENINLSLCTFKEHALTRSDSFQFKVTHGY